MTKAPESGVNAYMEALVKETVMLHKVLSRYLAAPIVEVRTACFALNRSASMAGMLTASCATASPSRPRLFWDACATLVCDDAGLRRYQSPPVRGVWPHRAAPPGGQGTVRRMTRAWVNVALNNFVLSCLVLSCPAPTPYCPRHPFAPPPAR